MKFTATGIVPVSLLLSIGVAGVVGGLLPSVAATHRVATQQGASTRLLVSDRPLSTNFPLAEVVPKLKRRTRLPILLPSNLPAFERRMYFAVKADANRYSVDINYTRDCRGTPCYYGAIEAEKGGQLSSPPPADMPNSTYERIRLINDSSGIYVNGCGAYCTAAVEWQQRGVLYRITVKNGAQSELVQMANSAIAAGVR